MQNIASVIDSKNKKQIISYLALVAAVIGCIVFYGFFTQTASAETIRIPLSSSSGDIECEWRENLLTTNLVKCVNQILVSFGQTQFNQILSALDRFIVAMMTLAVILLGMRTVFGVASKAEFSILALKICALVWVLLEGGAYEIMPMIITAAVGLGGMITDILASATGQPLSGFVTIDGQFIRADGILEYLDAVLIKVIGLNVVIAGSGYEKMAFFGVVVAGAFGGFGAYGSVVFGIIFMCITGLIMGAIITCYMFLASMFALTGLMMISPLIVPFIFFEYTKRMFEQWLGMILSFALQPLIVAIYLALTLVVIDRVFAEPVQTIYNDAKAILEDPKRKNSLVLFQSNREQNISGSFNRYGEKVNRSAAPFGEYTWMFHSSRNVDGGRYSWKKDPTTIDGSGNLIRPSSGQFLEEMDDISGGEISIPYIDWGQGDLNYIVSTFGAGLLLVWAMVTWMVHLPKFVNEIVGNRTITPLAQFAAPFEGMQKRVEEAVGKS